MEWWIISRVLQNFSFNQDPFCFRLLKDNLIFVENVVFLQNTKVLVALKDLRRNLLSVLLDGTPIFWIIP